MKLKEGCELEHMGGNTVLLASNDLIDTLNNRSHVQIGLQTCVAGADSRNSGVHSISCDRPSEEAESP